MLEHFFGSKTRVKLLQIFFRNPDKIFFVRELSRLAETQLNAIRREIAHLEHIGVIAHVQNVELEQPKTGNERSKYYQLQKDFMLLAEMQSLLNKAQLLEQKVFIDQVKSKGGRIGLFVLTGFFTQESKAPTDILLVGDLRVPIVEKIIKSFEEALDHQPIRYTLMDEKEFVERKELGDVFLYSILDVKHLKVVDELSLV
jgi:hypothetical protein